jgi:hypothetical protein
MHGGASPGAPKGERHLNYRHGLFTQEAIEDRREIIEWVRWMKKLSQKICMREVATFASTLLCMGLSRIFAATPPRVLDAVAKGLADARRS